MKVSHKNITVSDYPPTGGIVVEIHPFNEILMSRGDAIQLWLFLGFLLSSKTSAP